MKQTKKTYILTLSFFILTLTSCKKDKLQGDYEVLVGEWEWIETIEGYSGLHDTPTEKGYTKTINLKEKGNYKIYKDNDKIESGRIIFKNQEDAPAYDFALEFKRNTIFSKKQEFKYLCAIELIGTDTILIATNINWTHQPYHRYKRKK